MQDASTVLTKKLYYEDAYATEFLAKVLSVEGNDVVLDQTLFFPEEGGQSPDQGVLAGRRVLDVQIKDGEIHHILGDMAEEEERVPDGILRFAQNDKAFISEERVPDGILRFAQNDKAIVSEERVPYGILRFAQNDKAFVSEERHLAAVNGTDENIVPGMLVFGRISWPHRFSNMQQHSGEHLFSGIVHRSFGLENVGFHLSDSEVTLDYNGPLSMEQLLWVEREANAVIVRNIPCEVEFLSGEAARTAEYRSKLELSGEVRVVHFPGVDACACCAPHVARTGEIGCLKVVGVQNWKGGVRVNILCGARAMELFDRDHAMLTELSRSLTTSPEEVFGLVSRLREERAALSAKLRQMEIARMAFVAKMAAPTEGSIWLFEEELDPKAAQETVNRLMEKAGAFAGVFIGNDRDGYRFVIGSAKKDAREAANLLRKEFGARGGGKPAMVQGAVQATEEELRRAFAAM